MTTELSMGQNAPVPTSALAATVRWDAGPVGVDLSALLLTSEGRVRSDADFVFYNQPAHASGAVTHVSGAAGTDAVQLDLARVEPAVDRIVVVASADGGTVGQVRGLILTVADGSGGELLRVPLRGAGETAFLTGEFYRRAGAWKFRAVGQGYASGLAGLARDFGITVDDEPAPVAAPTSPPVAAPFPSPSPTSPPAAAPGPTVSLKKQKLIDMEKRVAASSPALLSLTKQAAVSLEKRGLDEHTARVALCLDISGSMFRLYRAGKVQQLAERVLALALRFDDDGEVDVFLFGAGAYPDQPMTLDTYQGYVDQMLKRHPLEGGTHYGKAMELVRRHYGGGEPVARTAPVMAPVPAYVMVVTDGATMDQSKTRSELVNSSFEPTFWQFMAIGAPNSREFAFLRSLDELKGRYVDNASFFAVEDPAGIRDDALFDLLMGEYPDWLRKARAGGLLPPS